MKRTFVFDKSEDELDELDEGTIIKETGIDAARVKEAVMKEMSGSVTWATPIRVLPSS